MDENENNFDQRMRKLKRITEEISGQIDESQAVLTDIAQKMNDMQERQRKRIQADNRVDSRILQVIQSAEEKDGANTAEEKKQ